MKSPAPCSECEHGTMHRVIEAYETRSSDGNVVTVPDVTLYRCDQCGETLIPATSARLISEYKARELEQLIPAELLRIFDLTDLTQKDFAEALGLGEKTFHRWLKGTQTVSRSMGYYLRAMRQFPEVFEWVMVRGWRKPAPARVRALIQTERPVFAALERRSAEQSRIVRLSSGSNPARAFVLEAVHCSS
ncbi:MAG: type II toxin-antitoxin system MqsA family antitoxin [Luteolibacter sp.]